MSESLRGRRVALIGGAGFIGHHLALKLAAEGAEVDVIDSLQINNLSAFSSKVSDLHNRDLYFKVIMSRLELFQRAGVRLHVLDARNYHALGTLLGETQSQVIVHLAAVAHAGRANKDPYSTFDHSLRTLENALDSAKRCEQFIYLSSSMVYGNFQSESVVETHPLEPLGIYGTLKLCGERIVLAYGRVFDLPFTIVRPSALYGPRCVSRRVGQVFIESAISGATLRVVEDGEDRLDFTYVDDVVQGLSLMMTNPNAIGQTFNLTYGASRPIQDLLDLVLAEFPDAAVERMSRDEMMPRRGTLDIGKARDLLGYDPQHPLERGIPKYIEWYRQLLGAEASDASERP